MSTIRLPLILIFFTSLLSIFLMGCNQEASEEKAVSKKVTHSTALEWKRWTPSVFAEAKEKKRLVLVDFAAQWCSFCKKMDQTTWKDPQVLAIIAKNYIPVRVDDEIDTELAEKYRDYGRPAIIVLNAEGKEIFKKTGYQAPQWMLWTLQGVLQDS